MLFVVGAVVTVQSLFCSSKIIMRTVGNRKVLHKVGKALGLKTLWGGWGNCCYNHNDGYFTDSLGQILCGHAALIDIKGSGFSVLSLTLRHGQESKKGLGRKPPTQRVHRQLTNDECPTHCTIVVPVKAWSHQQRQRQVNCLKPL